MVISRPRPKPRRSMFSEGQAGSHLLPSQTQVAGQASCRKRSLSGENHHRRVYRRSRIDESGEVVYYGRYQARFKPPREKLASGLTLIHNHLPLGGCDTHHAAMTLHHIAAFYYGRAEGFLDLGDGRFFTIPEMSGQDLCLNGLEKVKWVSGKARDILEIFENAKAASSSRNGANETNEHSDEQNVDRNCSQCAEEVSCSPPSTDTVAEELAFSSERAPIAFSLPINSTASFPSLEDSELNRFFDELGSPQFDVDYDFDIGCSDAPPNLSAGENSLNGLSRHDVLPHDAVHHSELPVSHSPEQRSLVPNLDGTVARGPQFQAKEVDLLHNQVNNLQQIINFQRDDFQRQTFELQSQLREAQMWNFELRRENENVNSLLQQRCFCLHRTAYL